MENISKTDSYNERLASTWVAHVYVQVGQLCAFIKQEKKTTSISAEVHALLQMDKNGFLSVLL